MRGSPLFRTLLVLAALLLAGMGLARLTAPARNAPIVVSPPVKPPESPSAATFELLLSGPAKSVTLDAGGTPFRARTSAGPLAGSLEIAGDAPLISLRVEWAENSPGHRFAKLRLDRPGKDSLEHVFNAPGEIDDIWEP